MSSILLQGGTVIQLGQNDHLATIQSDVLVEGNRITAIGNDISVPSDCEVIDCTNKIISPGFIDTHRHTWETALKGLCEDLTCISYFAQMFTAPFTFTPQDVFWGSLSGCLEAIDAGTTTILDFAHMNWTPDHGKRALAGTASSGIRSIFAFAPTVTLKSTAPTPQLQDGNIVPDWFFPNLNLLAKSKYISAKDSRVKMGFGFDFYFLLKDAVVDMFNQVKSLGITTITSHCARFSDDPATGVPQLLKSYDLLDKSIVLSHLGGAIEDDARTIVEAGAFVSASPSVEMTMGLGPPVCFRDDLPGLDSACSLGIDSHHATSGSMVNEMRVALIAARGNHAAKTLATGQIADKVCRTAQDAFIMGTIKGARALNMEDEIGSLQVGKKADLVVFDALSPAMMGAAQHDPVTAIVMHSSIADVQTVIVDGVVRKSQGTLLPVQRMEWDEVEGDIIQADNHIAWSQLSEPVLDAQRRFVANLPNHDMEQLKIFTRKLYGFP